MKTSKTILGMEHDRTEPSAARHRTLVAGLSLAILLIAAAVTSPTHAATSSPPPVSECSDFACEK
jgi:hypothetical protein